MRLREIVAAAALCLVLSAGIARADRIDYTYSPYSDLNRNKVATTAFSMVKTLFEKTRLMLDIELDQTTIPPLDANTGASRPARQSKSSFLKNRGQIIAGVQRDLFGNTEASASYYFSQEVDYRSQSVVGGLTQNFAEKNFTIELTGQYQLDSVGEILANGALLNRLKEVSKGSLRITQLLSPLSFVRLGVDGQRDEGFLSDPYRKSVIGGDTVQERVPGMRYRGAGWIEYDHFLATLAGSWSAEYRYAFDDWNLASHMLWFKFNKYINPDWILTTQYRYYIQSGIDFGDYAAARPGYYFAPDDPKLKDGEYHFVGLGVTCYLRAFCRNHPSWDFLRRTSAGVKYSRYFNDAPAGDAYSGNLLESRLSFEF
jgi:hypothetical protein